MTDQLVFEGMPDVSPPEEKVDLADLASRIASSPIVKTAIEAAKAHQERVSAGPRAEQTGGLPRYDLDIDKTDSDHKPEAVFNKSVAIEGIKAARRALESKNR